MKRIAPLVLLTIAAFVGCSKSSPTEPSSLASLSGYVQLCGFDALTVLTVTDAKGAAHMTNLDANGNYSFPAVLALGAYTMTVTRSPLAPKSINGDRLLVTGANQEFWVSLGCPSLTVTLDNTSCTALLNGVITGTLTAQTSGWRTDSVSLAPGQSVTAASLPAPDNYRILFNGVYKDGRSWQWDYTVPVTTTYTFAMSCASNGNAPTIR